MAANLDGMLGYLRDDDDLRNGVSSGHYNAGLAAAADLNAILEAAIDRTGVNDDGLITADDVRTLANHISNRTNDSANWRDAHGSESGGEDGFHLLRGDGGSYLFRNTGYVDQVADAIYSIGFGVSGGDVLTETGAQGRSIEEVAGWLNFFLNGRTAVYGTDAGETLYHSRYHDDYVDAESEIYFAGAGADSVWGGTGHDLAYLGAGADRADGGDGRDDIFGGAGDDTISGGNGADKLHGGRGADRIGGGNGDDRLWGNAGKDSLVGSYGDDILYGGAGDDLLESWQNRDTIYGGDGVDKLFGGDARDWLYGGKGKDSIYGEAGSDRLYGGNGDDTMWGYDGDDRLFGGNGNDRFVAMEGDDTLTGGSGADALFGAEGHDTIYGGAGADELWGQAGRDVFVGGAGADLIKMYESTSSNDVLIFKPGHSGTAADEIDRVEGFADGDKIDLSAFDGISFRADDFRGNGHASAFYNGTHLRIDGDGNGNMDMRIEFAWVGSLSASDFIL